MVSDSGNVTGLHPSVRCAQRLERSTRQCLRAGEKLFIDYASPTIALGEGGAEIEYATPSD